jgi:membrane protein involved in colicin uptake
MGIDEDDVYMGGACDLAIEWVPIGSLFQIHEYDGSESLVIFDESKWTRAE